MTSNHQHPAIEQRYRALFTHHPDGVCELDPEGHFLRCNEALEAISGYSEAQLLGRPFSEIIHEQAREYSLACFRAAAVGEVQRHESLGRQPSGELYTLDITYLPIVVEAEVVMVYAICRDITLHKQQQTDLRVKKRSLEASRDGVLIADATRPGLPIVYVNPAFLKMTGYRLNEVLGSNCRFLQGRETDPEAVQVIRDGIEQKEEVRLTLLNYRKDGTEFLNYLTLAPVFDEQERCTHFVGIQEDITRQRRNEQQIAHHSTHDLLTGLPNRELFSSRLAYDYQASLQSEHLLALLYINLDDFKTINNGLGHEVADKLLVATAERLKSLIEPGETLARLNGDEFALLIPGVDDEGSAIRRAEQVLRAVSRPFKIDDQWLHISASIGIASSGEPVKQASDMLPYGEIAMQGAKLQGRNTWQWYGELRSDVAPGELVTLRREIQQALDKQQFELHYQPIVDTLTGQVRSVEALVRWRHPSRGMISPGVFIPIAEQTGQIIDIGHRVLLQACRDMARDYDDAWDMLPVAVNISPLQFRRKGFLNGVKDILKRTGLPPDKLELEVTEGVLMSGADTTIELLHDLRGLGIKVAIDDFGTGFSSLSYLRDLPVAKVKLDRSFICDITHNKRNAAIVEGIITMAHHLGLTVVAEGIETPEQQEDLQRRQCDLLQGFWFSRPVPIDQLIALPRQLPLPGS